MFLNLDFAILNFIRDHFTNPIGDMFFPLFTSLGNSGILWILIALLAVFVLKEKKCGITILVALILSVIIGNLILKNLVARPRPFEGLENINLLIPIPLDFSFPSGHTMSSFAASFVIFDRSKKIGAIAIILSVLMGFSRLYLYVHFPSDVICGAILGILMANLAIKVTNKFGMHKIY